MAYVAIEELLKRGDSIYKLVTLASRRALELAGGSPLLIHSDSKKVSTLAIEEIIQNKVRYHKSSDDKKDKTKDKK